MVETVGTDRAGAPTAAEATVLEGLHKKNTESELHSTLGEVGAGGVDIQKGG